MHVVNEESVCGHAWLGAVPFCATAPDSIALFRALGLGAGFVFREPKDGGPIRATYVVNVNPNGWIPHKLVNIICNKQAMNITRIRNKLSDTAKVRESSSGTRGGVGTQ